MNEFVIVSDSTVDLPKEYLQAKQVPIISLSYIMDGVTYEEMDGLSHKEFFEKLRTGTGARSVGAACKRRERYSLYRLFFWTKWKL